MLCRRFIDAVKIFGILSIFWVNDVEGALSAPNESPLSLRLIDVETNISPVPVLFLNKKASIVVEGLEWFDKNQGIERKNETSEEPVTETVGSSILIYSTYINERQVTNGTLEVSEISNKKSMVYFPSSIDVGVIEVDDYGANSIRVVVHHVSNDDVIESSVTLDVRSCRQVTASIPILLAFGLFLIFKVHMIYSLFLAIFIGSCIVEGSIINGFKAVFDTYLLKAATDSDHVSTILFLTGVSALVAMINRSGGTSAVIKSLKRHSSKTRVAQFVIFTTGLIIFFDPYVSLMLVGNVLGSVVKGFPLSSEKMSFLIDTTAVPVASIFPKSTWLNFSADLFGREMETLMQLGYEEFNDASGYSLVLSSVKYQFYPILVLALAVLQILTGREMGPILNAENKARLGYNTSDQNDEGLSTVKERSWNWYIPVVTLNIFLWIAFSEVDIDNTGSLGTIWLSSTVATIIITQIILIFQKRDGKIPFFDDYFDRYTRDERDTIAYLTDTFPSASGSVSIPYNFSSKSEYTNDDYMKTVDDDHQKILQMNTEEEANGAEEKTYFDCLKEPSLLNLQDGIECLVRGTTNAMPLNISLVFTWATGSVYQALGIDRVIISWILSDGISSEILPVTVFFSSFLLSMIIGSSWCTVSILIQTTLIPLADSLGGDSKGLCLILASILSGAAAGDHIGPFSESTILSALVSGIEIRQHFLTQAPYALFVLVTSLLVGTLPVSYGSYTAFVGYIVGVAILIIFVIFVCRQVKRYQSSNERLARGEPITQIVHPMIATQVERTEEKSVMSLDPEYDLSDKENQQQQPKIDDCSVISSTQEGTEVVEMGNGIPSIQIRTKSKNFLSYRSKLEKIDDEESDPIKGLMDDDILPQNFRSELQKARLGQRLPSVNEQIDPAKENKKRLIEATIKKAELDGNVFSDSLRNFLRTAQMNLGNMLEDPQSMEISASGSGESSGDDSLDNLMMNIAANGWRSSINNLLGDGAETVTSGGGYTTDGGSSMMESDDSATAGSSSLGGHGQSTYYSGNGDVTSCASSTTGPSTYSTSTSGLLNPLEFGKSRQSLHGWTDNEDFSTNDDGNATDYTKASF
uniref:Na+/H+ antiporter NhaC-like C-terminal domain-containing protein n=1 Tax=Pseudo-nitzschia australis TaxID=44445 RepID=A0A7S4AB14_9STRA|mmetsp:Transcript_5553/g.11462  ORF Transcript_5553/g.11462 Transcript_5553/m.11462 type:complete len:1092 (+) Transcript_5553:187-3462(+)